MQLVLKILSTQTERYEQIVQAHFSLFLKESEQFLFHLHSLECIHAVYNQYVPFTGQVLYQRCQSFYDFYSIIQKVLYLCPKIGCNMQWIQSEFAQSLMKRKQALKTCFRLLARNTFKKVYNVCPNLPVHLQINSKLCI